MPRRGRTILPDTLYHVMNRAAGRLTLFRKPEEYAAFEATLEEAIERFMPRVLGYAIMPSQWHLVVWPNAKDSGEVSRFFHWLTMTHTKRHHAARRTSGQGPLYQGRFKIFPVAADHHLLMVMRYLEGAAQRARLVGKARLWRWSSLWHHVQGNTSLGALLSFWPVPRPADWLSLVERSQPIAEQEAISRSLARGAPLGDNVWSASMVKLAGLEHTIRPRGRPRLSPALGRC